MKREYRNIVRLFNVVNRALFRRDSTLSYQRTLEAIERLSQEVLDTETDEDVWYIGEFGDCTLDTLIVGAYWFLTDYHAGMHSLEYRVLCRLGEIFNPGMTAGPEPDTSEVEVYKALEFALESEK
jgi:hypothetical protein